MLSIIIIMMVILCIFSFLLSLFLETKGGIMKPRQFELIIEMKDEKLAVCGGDTMKEQMLPEKVLNSPLDDDALGMVFLNIDITFAEKSGKRSVLRGRKRAVFNGADWESEFLWQAVRVIVDHNGSKDEACNALKMILGKLQEHPAV